jgi:hypothetical protein
MDDLNAFEDEFFQREKPVDKEDTSEEVDEEVSEDEDDPLAAEEDTDAPAETGDEDEVEEEDDSEEEEEPQPKPKPKSKAQQRIEKLLERERLANERANTLEQRLAALEARNTKEEPREEQAPALRDQLPADAPNPDAKDKDGNPLYPLGEFDPQFIRDFTQFTIDEQMKIKQEKEQREAQERMVAEQRSAIQNNWHTKLEAAEEEIPDIRESISDLVDTFQNVEPAYGEYLASVIMASDLGPQLMYYLSQNIGEAQKIVASGPAAATLALGRLEARLTPQSKSEKRNTKRESEAPRPPEARTRGAGGRFSISPDTDDLDAFEREFFKK